jgi:hypothetical protein
MGPHSFTANFWCSIGGLLLNVVQKQWFIFFIAASGNFSYKLKLGVFIRCG